MQKRFNPLKPNASTPKPSIKVLPKGTVPNPSPVGPAPILTENDDKDGLELRFPKRPGPAVLDFFHSTKDLPAEQRWHFHFKGKYWYARRNDATRKFAQMLIAHASEKAPEPTAPTAPPAPAIVPIPKDPLEAKWEEETGKGLTSMPFELWIEKYTEAKGDEHPEPIEEPASVPVSNVIPVKFNRSLIPAWKRKFGQWCPVIAKGADGNPVVRY
jgi:hypothetical protein